MRSLILGAGNGTGDNASNQYLPPIASLASWQSTETDVAVVVPHALTLQDFIVNVDSAPGAGKSWTFTIMKNGVATALTVTISDTNLTASDQSHSVSFAAGDRVSIRSTPSGTPAAANVVTWAIGQIAARAQAIMSTNLTGATGGAVRYKEPFGTGGWQATETNADFIVPTSGTLKNLFAKMVSAPSSGKSYTFTIRKNGADTAVTCTIANSNTTANDTTHSVSVAAGDRISLQSTPSGTPSSSAMFLGFTFQPDNDGESILGLSSSTNPSTGTRYDLASGNAGAWSSTEAFRQVPMLVATLKAIYARIEVDPASGKTYVPTVRKNAADTALTVTLDTSNLTANLSSDVEFARGDKIDLKLVITSGATLTPLSAGILIYIPTGVTRSAKIAGKDTANTSRAAKTHGQDAANVARSAKIQGKDTANVSRASKIHGQVTVNAERSAKVRGQDSANVGRSAKITGAIPAATEFAAKIRGQESTSVGRSAKIRGKASTSTTFSAKIKGKPYLIINAKITGTRAENDEWYEKESKPWYESDRAI